MKMVYAARAEEKEWFTFGFVCEIVFIGLEFVLLN